MQTVRQLHDDNADILCHRQQHLADVLCLTLFLGGIVELGQLGNAVYHQGNIIAKQLFDFPDGCFGILHHIVQKSRADGLGIHTQLHQNLSNRQRMGDVWLSGLSHLAIMRLFRIVVRLRNFIKIVRSVAFAQYLQQIFKHIHKIIHQPLAAAKSWTLPVWF